MAQTVTAVDTEEPKFSNKTVYHVRTDSGTTYVFEAFPDSPEVRFVRRGEGPDGRKDCTTNNYTLPGDVRRVANVLFGNVREPCSATAREPERPKAVGWRKA